MCPASIGRGRLRGRGEQQAIYQVEKEHVARCMLLPLALALSLTDSGRTSRRGRCRPVECFSLFLFFSKVWSGLAWSGLSGPRVSAGLQSSQFFFPLTTNKVHASLSVLHSSRFTLSTLHCPRQPAPASSQRPRDLPKLANQVPASCHLSPIPRSLSALWENSPIRWLVRWEKAKHHWNQRHARHG